MALFTNGVDDEDIDESDSDDNFDSIGEYSFETPRLAYKANTDYKNLVQNIMVLKAQKAQAIRDRERLLECEQKALENPLEFIEKLQKKEDLGIPKPQALPHIPPVDWSRYDIAGHGPSFGRHRLGNWAAANYSRKRKLTSDMAAEMSTFNKPWTAEEQQKLEKLLVEFPPEEVETRRWEKISAALGTRTPTQVASRVQKYFAKLVKAGAPVPGKPPSWSYLAKAKQSRGHSQKTSATGPAFGDSSSEEVSDEEDISPDLRDTEEYKELMLVKKVLKKKMKRGAAS